MPEGPAGGRVEAQRIHDGEHATRLADAMLVGPDRCARQGCNGQHHVGADRGPLHVHGSVLVSPDDREDVPDPRAARFVRTISLSQATLLVMRAVQGRRQAR